jgi:hypothetical protein
VTRLEEERLAMRLIAPLIRLIAPSSGDATRGGEARDAPAAW